MPCTENGDNERAAYSNYLDAVLHPFAGRRCWSHTQRCEFNYLLLEPDPVVIGCHWCATLTTATTRSTIERPNDLCARHNCGLEASKREYVRASASMLRAVQITCACMY